MNRSYNQRVQTHSSESLTARNWPIAAGMLPFPPVEQGGGRRQTLGQQEWEVAFREVERAGFDHVEVTDTWLRAGDLSSRKLADLSGAAMASSQTIAALALIRRSILEKGRETDNLQYSHRSIDAAAELGARVLSVGLHEPLTPRQRRALWFWSEDGARNPHGDPDQWARAIAGFRELGRHAADAGVLLTLEMYEDTYLGSAANAVRLIEEIDLPEVGLNPDTGNLIRLHRPIEAWDEVLRTVLPYANYWHVKNYLRDEDPATGAVSTFPISLELGLIDYRAALAEAIEVGFAGVITCEHYGGDGLSVAATNREYLRRILPGGTR